ncbi:uncharacterized protein LOC110881778 [Helianthus annuus]|uniref:uncharacterized protein LOC110881778 n=1 Tax=Helianthus annuus TaxID=4232 RepID=UPI000B8F0DB6|nr:uncharacterized protein LOC110881778 [Helianthus annuus]
MRQGDPISPFLFVIVMEALSCMLDKACEVQIMKGVHLPEDGSLVSHLFYADDAFIIGEWCKENVLNVGLVVLKWMISVEVGCKSDSLPFKYLGLSVGANMNRIVNWRPVYEIFDKRLSLWKSVVLSIGGRVTLI